MIKDLRDKINFYLIARILTIFWCFNCIVLFIMQNYILSFVSAVNVIVFFAIQNEIKESFEK